MAKHKKKHAKKDTLADDFLSVAALSIKKYRKVANEIAKLSTGQKVVGGVAVLVAGYFYLDKVKNEQGHNPLLASLDAHLPWLSLTTDAPEEASAEDRPEKAPPVQKRHKTPKPNKASGAFGKTPAASPDDF